MHAPALLPLLLAPFALAIPTPIDDAISALVLSERATASSSLSIPIDFTFGVTVPTGPNTNPAISLGGYQFPLGGAAASSGNLVSFLGNFHASNPLSAQLTSINPAAPRNVSTSSSSTSIAGGPSTSNATASAMPARIVSTTFSSGNASSGAAASGAGGDGTSTSSSSSGASNSSSSTAVADATGLTSIFTNATTADASDAQSVQNARAASAATSCAAQNDGAQASSAEISTVTVPVGQPDQHLGVVSSAYAACAAGVAAPQQPGTSSASGSQASLAGVSSSVTCNGVTSTHRQTSTTFRISVVGTFSAQGFTGAITGQRVAQSVSSC